MPILYSALVPHSPLLLPAIGKEARSSLQNTLTALEQVKSAIQEKNIETLVLLTVSDEHKKHGSLFRIILPPAYSAEFGEFGDLVTHWSSPSDMVLGTEIKNDLVRADIKTSYKSDPNLDYTAGVPLSLLVKEGGMNVLVITPAETDTVALFSAGRVIHATLQRSPKRIACIASGDLAHCTEKKATHEHYAKTCLPFDYMFLDAVQKKRSETLRAFNAADAEKLGACALPVSIVLRGILDGMHLSPHTLSYEAPFGVGYTATEFLS
jgi:aromatic ring-opening dioxygenase catalytic subunit (LigB family)